MAKTFWLQCGPNLADHFGKVMVGLLGSKWPKLGKPKSHQKVTKIQTEPIVDFQYRAIIAPEEPQITTTQPKSSQCQSNPPNPPCVIVIYCCIGKTNTKI